MPPRLHAAAVHPQAPVKAPLLLLHGAAHRRTRYGLSIVPTQLGRTQTAKYEWLYWETYEGPAPFQQAVRLGPWKGYRTGTKAPLELYRLDRDPAETNNIAAEHPEGRQRSNRTMRGRDQLDFFFLPARPALGCSDAS